MDKSPLSASDRVILTAEKIRQFKELPVGWNYGEGVPPTEETISTALRLNIEVAAAGFKRTNAFPGENGEIQVTAYHQSIYLEMMIEPDGLITFVYEDGDQEVEYRQMTLVEVISRIHKFRGRIWASSGLFTSSTTTPIKSALRVSPSSLQVTRVEFPLSILSVSHKPAVVSVSTSTTFILTSQEPLQYFGIYQSENFPNHIVLSNS